MAAHRMVWHKGLQRCALLTRKLGLAAWVMATVGVIGFLLIIAGVSPIVALGLLIGSMLIPAVYSFIHYKSLERRGAL